MLNSSIEDRLLGARAVATGAPAGDALENINTTTLDDGAHCYVVGGVGAGDWQLDRASSAVANGTTIVAPAAGGPGRWFKRSLPTSTAGSSASVASAQYNILGSAVQGADLPITESLDGYGFGLAANVVTVPSVGRYKISFAIKLVGPSDAILYVGIYAGIQLTSFETTAFPLPTTVSLSGISLVDISDPATQGIFLRNGSAPGNNFSSVGGRLIIERIGDIPA